MRQILEGTNLGHYKNLRYGMKEFKRTRTDSSFVLVFKTEGGTVIFGDLEHHGRIYRRNG